MALLDGLNEELRNPLLENELDFRLAEEADFEAGLEAATEKQLSDADVAAILGGADDLPQDEIDVDDPDDPTDDVDITIPETVKPAAESDTDIASILQALEGLSEPDSVSASEASLIAECEQALDACGKSSCNKGDNPASERIEVSDDTLAALKGIDKTGESEEPDPKDIEDALKAGGELDPATETGDDDVDDDPDDDSDEDDDSDKDDVSFESLLQQCLDNA